MCMRIVFCLLVLVTLAGCGYQLQGRVVQGGFGTISLVEPTDQRLQVQGLQLGPTDATTQIQEPVEVGSGPPRAGQERPAPAKKGGGRQRRAIPCR